MSEEEQANLKYEICRKYGDLGLTSKVPSKAWENLIDNEIDLINQLTELKEENKRWQTEHKRINLAGAEKVKELKQQLADAEDHIDALELQLREQYQLVDEKDKEVEDLENKISLMQEQDMIFHNQLAIQELEKVKDWCKFSTNVSVDLYAEIRSLIDQRIKELKVGKDVEKKEK